MSSLGIRTAVPELPWDKRVRIYCKKCDRYSCTVSELTARNYEKRPHYIPCSWCKDEE